MPESVSGAGSAPPPPPGAPGGISRDEVVHVARLARLSLSEEEIDMYAPQLAAILGHAGAISELDLHDVPPTTHALPLHNVLRADVPGECLTPSAALAAAPDAHGGRFRVPRILEDEET